MSSLYSDKEVAEVVCGITGKRISPAEHSGGGRRPSTRRADLFIRGPMPLRWWQGAAGLSRSALHVGLALFYLRGLSRRDRFKLSPARLRELGVERNAKRRGLAELEAAGLVRVYGRGRGRVPEVEMLFPEPPGTGEV